MLIHRIAAMLTALKPVTLSSLSPAVPAIAPPNVEFTSSMLENDTTLDRIENDPARRSIFTRTPKASLPVAVPTGPSSDSRSRPVPPFTVRNVSEA